MIDEIQKMEDNKTPKGRIDLIVCERLNGKVV